jgi:choline kinase
LYNSSEEPHPTNTNTNTISTALLLAAGTGSRLYPFTKDMPKCLTEVNGISILERLVSSLTKKGFKRLVVVTGYMDNCIHEFLGSRNIGMDIDYVFSPRYKTTNNIYSLWMARETIKEPFMLIESDLVFDESLLDNMVYPDRIAVARMQPWMNGTTVTIDKLKQVEAFQKADTWTSDDARYKTVNIYSFSQASWVRIKDRLDQYICAGKVHDYYETVFAGMVADGSLSFDSVSFDEKAWYEIDTVEDLMKAEKLFSTKKPFATESRNIRKYIPDKIRDSLLKSTSDSMKSLVNHTPKVKDISIKIPKLNLDNI